MTLKYRRILFTVYYNQKEKAHKLNIPELVEDGDVVHTRLRATTEHGLTSNFGLYLSSSDRFLAQSVNGVLDIGSIKDKLLDAAEDSQHAKEYRSFGANLNRIDRLCLKFDTTDDYIVIAEMLTTSD